MANVTKEDAEVLSKIVSTIFDWSGASDAEPDTIILESPYGQNITLDDLLEATRIISSLKNG
jgi:hypothetical protein